MVKMSNNSVCTLMQYMYITQDSSHKWDDVLLRWYCLRSHQQWMTRGYVIWKQRSPKHATDLWHHIQWCGWSFTINKKSTYAWQTSSWSLCPAIVVDWWLFARMTLIHSCSLYFDNKLCVFASNVSTKSIKHRIDLNMSLLSPGIAMHHPHSSHLQINTLLL